MMGGLVTGSDGKCLHFWRFGGAGVIVLAAYEVWRAEKLLALHLVGLSCSHQVKFEMNTTLKPTQSCSGTL